MCWGLRKPSNSATTTRKSVWGRGRCPIPWLYPHKVGHSMKPHCIVLKGGGQKGFPRPAPVCLPKNMALERSPQDSNPHREEIFTVSGRRQGVPRLEFLRVLLAPPPPPGEEGWLSSGVLAGAPISDAPVAGPGDFGKQDPLCTRQSEER